MNINDLKVGMKLRCIKGENGDIYLHETAYIHKINLENETVYIKNLDYSCNDDVFSCYKLEDYFELYEEYESRELTKEYELNELICRIWADGFYYGDSEIINAPTVGRLKQWAKEFEALE